MDHQDGQQGLLAQWTEDSSRIIFFGGVGVLTESGIPDFRDAKGFYHRDWEIPSEQVLSTDFFTVHPQAYWEWFTQENAREGVAPNAVYRFVADLERAGKLSAVVTQNIDGLHQRAGSERVLELYDDWPCLICIDCGARFLLDDVDSVRSGEVSHCLACASVLRPNIVFYGEMLDSDVMEGVVRAISEAGLLIMTDTSLVAYPVASFIDYYAGGRLALINATPTPYNSCADLIIREPADQVSEGSGRRSRRP